MFFYEFDIELSFNKLKVTKIQFPIYLSFAAFVSMFQLKSLSTLMSQPHETFLNMIQLNILVLKALN